MKRSVVYMTAHHTPVGTLYLATTDRKRLSLCSETPSSAAVHRVSDDEIDILQRSCRALDEYFTHTRTDFHDIPLQLEGTGFQQLIRRVLQDIPYGHTVSYRELAAAAGRPQAVRAAAGAIASNPLLLFLPCHRVIRADGSPGDYRLGRDLKVFLLAWERSTAVS